MKYVVLTGSCGGMGKAIRTQLLSENYYVIGLDLKDDGFKNKNYIFYNADVTNEELIKEIKTKILSLTDSLYTVINASGIFMMETFVEGDIDNFKKIMNINLMGPFIINKTFIPLLSKGGRIINISSEVGRYSPQPFNGYYALSKISLDKYNDVLRRECNYIGIKVSKIQSGAIKTNLLGGVNKDYESIVGKTKYFKNPLTKLKSLMDNEIKKTTSPTLISNCVSKILKSKHPRNVYKIKNSFALSFLNILPEKLQDFIYLNYIK